MSSDQMSSAPAPIDDTTTDDAESVERTLDLDASVDAVWSAVCDPTSWLADDGWMDVRPGGRGRLIDDGIERDVAIDEVDEVEDGRRLVYRWWTGDEGRDAASRVEITVLGGDSATRLVIRESRPAVAAQASATALAGATRWNVRAACLAFGATAARCLV